VDVVNWNFRPGIDFLAVQALVEHRQFGSCNYSTEAVDQLFSVPYSPLPVLLTYAWGMATIGMSVALAAYIFVACFSIAATRQIFKIRTEYLKVM
jgi:hypothetical protein